MPLAVVRTNLAPSAVPAKFLRSIHDLLLEVLPADPKLIMAELHCDVTMIRNGSTGPMVTVEIHHSDDSITAKTKRGIADRFAEVLMKQLKINLERILVLFFDTRCCSMLETTHL